jgi:hypothetical protein
MNSGNIKTIPGTAWKTVDVSSADFENPENETFPLAFMQDTTGAVSFRSFASGNTITRTFVGGVIHYVGSFDRIFASGTTATSISIIR